MPVPSDIKLHRRSQILEVVFSDLTCELPAEFLRVHSPSAEVRGHGPGQEELQHGKQDVGITGIEPQGNYAIKLIFSDGHDSGIYAWDYLYDLGSNQDQYWQTYLEKLKEEGKTREAGVSVVKLMETSGCASATKNTTSEPTSTNAQAAIYDPSAPPKKR